MLLIRLLIAVIIAAIFPTPAGAQDAGKEAMARMQYMLRQISAEKDALQAENAKLKTEMQQTQAEQESTIEKLTADNKKLKSQLEKYKDYGQQKQQQLVDVNRTLSDARADQQALQQAFDETKEQLGTCTANNHKLYEINSELVDAYNDKDSWDAILQKEPLTQLKKVEIENLVQDYHFRIEDNKFQQHQSDNRYN